jgi:hemoglobin
MATTEIADETLHRLVDEFYSKIRTGADLGPIFARAIPGDCEPHLSTMRKFWSSIMLSSGQYKGNPVAVHRHVAGIEMELIDRWLTLFDQTSRQIFVDELADAILEKAVRIAESLKISLFYWPDRPWARRAT